MNLVKVICLLIFCSLVLGCAHHHRHAKPLRAAAVVPAQKVHVVVTKPAVHHRCWYSAGVRHCR